MNPPGAVWLGDAARAFASLQPGDGRTRRAIARLLGLDWRAGSPGPAPAEPVEPAPPPPPPPPRRGPLPKPPKRPPRAPAAGAPPQALEPVAFEPPRQQPLPDTPSLPRPTPPDQTPALEPAPLFRPRWTRDILALSLATSAADGPVDLDALVAVIAAGRPVERLPRRPRPSLFRGVQLLLDIGEGMAPYARDQDQLARRIRRVVGQALVTELQFRYCPLPKAGAGPIWEWRRYQPPNPGTPVLALTDLGIGGPRVHPQRSRPGQWLALVRLLASRGSPLVAYIPYRQARWPRSLSRAMTLLHWDRSTPVGRVQAAVGAVLGLRR